MRSCDGVAVQGSSVREGILVKNNVPGGDNASGFQVEATIAFMLERHAEENATNRARGEFMWHGGVQVWVAQAPKGAKGGV